MLSQRMSNSNWYVIKIRGPCETVYTRKSTKAAILAGGVHVFEVVDGTRVIGL